MKKIATLILLISLVFGLASASFSKEGIFEFVISKYIILIDGVEQNISAVIINNKTYVPLRDIAEKLERKVNFYSETGVIDIRRRKARIAEVENEAVASYVGDDWSVFRGDNGLYGYKDANRKVVIEPQFFGAEKFHEGRAVVFENDMKSSLFRYGYIDTKGDIVIPLEYFGADEFSDGLACVQPKPQSNEVMFIDRAGENVFGKIFISGYSFREGYASVKVSGSSYPTQYLTNPPPDKYSYIDKTGERATNKEWDWADSFKDGFAIVREGDVRMIIDTDFEVVDIIGDSEAYHQWLDAQE